MGKHIKDEQELTEQEKNIQRKITQLQLEELTYKGKNKIQAPVTTPVPEVGTMATVSPGGPQLPPVQQAQVQPTPPVVNVYAQHPQQCNNDNGQHRHPQNNQRKGFRSPHGPPRTCWGCHQLKHFKINCPTNPWKIQGNRNQNEPQRNGYQIKWNQEGGWQNNQRQPQDPMNPWAWPNQGY